MNNFCRKFQLRFAVVFAALLTFSGHAGNPLWNGAGSVTNNNFSNTNNWFAGKVPVTNSINGLPVGFGPLDSAATNTANCDATGNSQTWTFNAGTAPMVVTLNGQQLGAATGPDVFVNNSTNLQTIYGSFVLFDIGGSTTSRRFNAAAGPLAIATSQIKLRGDSAPATWSIEFGGSFNGSLNTTFNDVNFGGTVNYLKTGVGSWEVLSALPNLTTNVSALTVSSGILTLDAANTFSGATLVASGATLNTVTLATGAGACTVSNTAVLGVTLATGGSSLTNASLTLGTTGADATTLNFNLSTNGNPLNPIIAVTGALNVNGTCTINISNGTLFAGQFPLLQYGSQTGSGVFILGALPGGVTASLTNNLTNSSIDLVVTASLGYNNIIYWNGNASALWDTNSSANWKLNAQTGLTYADTNQVVFDDTASGNFAVTLNGVVKPISVTVSNSATNYTFTGSGGIGGATALNKFGSSVLALGTANSYSGQTVVNSGALVLNNLSAVPPGSGLNIANGAVVQPNLAGTYANVTTTLNGSSHANGSFGGALDFHLTGTETWPGQINLNAANATIGCYGVTCNVTLSGQLTGSGSLTIRPEGGSALSHTATYTLSNPTNNYAGSTTMQVGTAELSATLKVGVDSALPVTTALTLDRAGTSGFVYFDLAGHAQTLAGLTSDFGSNAVINSTGTGNLTVSNSADTTFIGVIGTSGKAGINLVKQGSAMLTLSGTNLYTGSTTISNGTLALNGLITATSGLLMSSNATLQIGLDALGGQTNIVVNGNLTLAGQINVNDLGFTASNTYPIIYYTGSLTNNGITVAASAPCVFTVDTSVPHVVNLVVGQKLPLIQFSNTNFNVTTLTTNLSGILRGSTAGPIWYEVRDQTNKMWDFGARLATTPWSITVRHLRTGTNTVTIFAQDNTGTIQSNSILLALNLGAYPSVRPRPIPSEIWWGGLATNGNPQMTNYSQWPFVQRFQDGYFFHSANVGTAAWQRSLATNLLQFNTKYWPELGGNTPNPTTNSAASQIAAWGSGFAANMQANGIIWSEFTHDYHMENMKPVCQANPTWPTNDDIAWWTGDLSMASSNYPYSSGIWRDVFNGYYQLFPQIKVGHTSQPEWWPWGNYPAGVSDSTLAFTITNSAGQNINFSLNASNIFSSFMNMAAAIGHPYFSQQSDTPWDYFGGGGVGTPASEATMRQMIRAYEKYDQSRGGRHTLICNVSDASSAKQGSQTAADLYYESSSLSSMMLHQQEGGRANRYLYESWYWNIPYVTVPETQAGTYTHLALSAIKYLKGIMDTNGTPEPLNLGIISTGTTNVLAITNNGDVACLPAITVSESGSGYLVARYFNAAGQDVTTAMSGEEGYCHTNMLQPGQSTTFTVVVSALASTSPSATRSFTFEAFWNPQDPTGVVRDRKTISVTASNLVSTPNPVAWYALDGNANDSSGNGFNGTASKVSYVTGLVGTQAGSFNGTASYIQIPGSVSNDFTLSFWVKTTQVGGTGQWTAGRGLVDATVAGTTNDFGISLVSSNAAFGVGNPDTTITSTDPISDGQWHHVAATRVNSTGAMTLYVDGVWQTNTTGPTGTRTAAPVFRLGSLLTAANYFSGTLDEVRLYGSALNGAQIAALATLPPANTAPTLTALADRTLIAGQTLTLTNSASDPDAPPQTLAFGLVGAPTGMTLNPTNGVLIWRPTVAQSPTTNTLSVTVTDNGTPNLSATQSFSVFVTRPTVPVLGSLSVSNSGFGLTVTGDTGPDYSLYVSTNLLNWVLLQSSNSPALPFRFVDAAATNFSRRFYRVGVGP